MNLLVMLTLVLLTIFYPYLQMQAEWYLLLFRHWKYQTHSAILMAIGKRYQRKGEEYINSGEHKKANTMLKAANRKIAQIRKLGDRFEPTIQQFRDRYIG